MVTKKLKKVLTQYIQCDNIHSNIEMGIKYQSIIIIARYQHNSQYIFNNFLLIIMLIKIIVINFHKDKGDKMKIIWIN